MSDADDLSEHEADTLAGLEEINREYAADFATQLRAAGQPEHLVAAAVAEYEEMLAARLERAWPLMRRDMQISAGRARLQ